jgi:hypothetical protein
MDSVVVLLELLHHNSQWHDLYTESSTNGLIDTEVTIHMYMHPRIHIKLSVRPT